MEAQDILGSETGRGPFSHSPRAEGRQAVDKGAGAYRDAGDTLRKAQQPMWILSSGKGGCSFTRSSQDELTKGLRRVMEQATWPLGQRG